MISAEHVAAYFLAKAAQEDGEFISNLKLQKLLYYAQGSHLALDKGPLFPESTSAWNHGPVVTSVYHKYKEFGASPLSPPEDFDVSQYSEELQEFLDEVYSVYGQFSAGKLRKMTHEEPPWIEAFENNRGTISRETMKTFFKTLLIKDEAQGSLE
ncbi:MAG: hypothetical protein QOF62_895 [Pyrinomonadaceae bacterium]|jgi:uncharacterized phage-associated protein|nr:hypothetical protein [Pyrinomonadaceae bacterium]